VISSLYAERCGYDVTGVWKDVASDTGNDRVESGGSDPMRGERTSTVQPTERTKQCAFLRADNCTRGIQKLHRPLFNRRQPVTALCFGPAHEEAQSIAKGDSVSLVGSATIGLYDRGEETRSNLSGMTSAPLSRGNAKSSRTATAATSSARNEFREEAGERDASIFLATIPPRPSN